GIGLALTMELAKQGNVIATVRDLSKAEGTPLKTMPNVTVVQLEAESESSILKAASEIANLAPTGIDALWNNIGVSNISKASYSMENIGLGDLTREITINAVAPIVFTTRLLPLLEKRDTRKIVFITSLAGSMTSLAGMPAVVSMLQLKYTYSTSKTTLNSLINLLHIQLIDKNFTIVPMHPGFVLTDMTAGNPMVSQQPPNIALPPELTPMRPEQSATCMVTFVEKQTASDKFALYDFNGKEHPW
ncbi:uncharacterized protein V1518DRAFT_368830, partial [Limtongia smithiae]|uniref:uncharacterized protein n=1 Tax=Limtongia smithiae TaxID=1125753 RepID=UPI0034CFB3E7